MNLTFIADDESSISSSLHDPLRRRGQQQSVILLYIMETPAHSHSPSPPDEQPSHDSPHGSVAQHSAFYNGHGTFKNPLIATRCPLGHPLPLEPLVSISAALPIPTAPSRPTRSSPTTPRTARLPIQRSTTDTAHSRTHSSPPVARLATPCLRSR